MRIAFYAPLKPPDHPQPSGDRRMARLVMQALAAVGYRVELASHFRSRDGAGDRKRQARLGNLGERLAARIDRRYQAMPAERRPVAWFTYHLYYKAPDWLGPAVARALDIPYFVAEASLAPKRANGAWACGHAAVLDALDRAAAVFTLNSADTECLKAHLPGRGRLVPLRPFLAPGLTGRLVSAGQRRLKRRDIADRFDLNPNLPWLLTVAMMRPGDKLASYQVLGRALDKLHGRSWQLIVVGDGPARPQVEAALAIRRDTTSGDRRIVYAGVQDEISLGLFYDAADLFVWPAINEAYGMALLEAQAAGLPAVAGASGGVADILRHKQTGLLVEPHNINQFVGAVDILLENKEMCTAMRDAATEICAAEHSFAGAVRIIGDTLGPAIQARAALRS